MSNRYTIAVNFSKNCNNNCLFCFCREKDFLRQHLRTKPIVDFEDVKSIILRYRENSNVLILAGNEPTLNENLFRTVKFAKRNNYIVGIQTNGRLFHYKDYCRRAIESGIDYFTVSILSSVPGIHDSLTRTPGSFKQTISGIKNIVAFDAASRLMTCTVLTQSNYKNLPSLVDFLHTIGVRSMKLNNVYHTSRNIVPKFSQLKEYLFTALKRGKSHSMEIKPFGFPLCILGRFWMDAAEFSLPQEIVVGCRVSNASLIRKKLGKSKPISCRKCNLNNYCEGTWKSYYRIYGDKEFEDSLSNTKRYFTTGKHLSA